MDPDKTASPSAGTSPTQATVTERIKAIEAADASANSAGLPSYSELLATLQALCWQIEDGPLSAVQSEADQAKKLFREAIADQASATAATWRGKSIALRCALRSLVDAFSSHTSLLTDNDRHRLATAQATLASAS